MARKKKEIPADGVQEAQTVEVIPEQKPPKPQPVIAQVADPIVPPRNPDDVVHNIVVRQLADDIASPPAASDEESALSMLSQVMQARKEGKSLEAFKHDLARLLQNTDELYKLVWHLYRRHRCDQLLDWLTADDAITKFLTRCFRRGDLTPTEALVLKRMSTSAIKELVDEYRTAMSESETLSSHGESSDLLSKLDVTLKLEDKNTHSILTKTTPQGREIVRKLVFTARQKMFDKNGSQ